MRAAAYAEMLDAFAPQKEDAPSCAVARGDVGDWAESCASEIAGVSDEAWSRFVEAMKTAPLGEVSSSNALGMFELTPRRLADLGVMSSRLRRTKSPITKKTIWTGWFLKDGKIDRTPASADAFLRSPWRQYDAFAASMRDYASRIASGAVAVPDGVSLAGALAILHRAGPRGLENWSAGNRFKATEALYERARGAF